MRAIAAGSILLYHVWLYGAPHGASVDLGPATKLFDNLRAGVTLFFVLSGFLLYRPYVSAALRRRPTPSWRRYFRNRALRILPAYWVILLVVALAFEHGLLSRPRQLLANALLLQDYVPKYIFGAGIVPAWSLTIEVVFYLWVPLLGLAAIRLARRRGVNTTFAAVLPVLAMVSVGWGAKAAEHFFALGRVWDVTFPVHADWFAGGMTLAVVRVLWEDGRVTLPRHWQIPGIGLALVLGAVSAAAYYRGSLSYVEYQTPIVASCTIALACVVLAEPQSRLLAVLEWRPFAAAGVASYSVFLWHDPVLRFLRAHGLTSAGVGGYLLNVALVASITAVLSAATYVFVEKPALSRKRGWQRPPEAPSAPVTPAEAVELRAAASSVAAAP